MKKIEDNLVNNLGFSYNKARVYLSILESGEITASDIAKKAGIKRTTAYNIIPELINEGFIVSTQKNKKKYFFIDTPKQLQTNLEEKLTNINNIIPNLLAIQSINPYKPKITYYEGIGGMKEIYQDVSNNTKSGDEILSFIGSANIYEFIPKEIERKHVGIRIKNKVINKIISGDSLATREWIKTSKEELRQIKIIENKKINFQADMKIYKNKVCFISYKENYTGLIIESNEIYQLLKTGFLMLWEML